MVKQGPVPAFVHSLIEYIAGALLIAAPLLLDYKAGAATAASIVLGVLVLFLVATTTSTLSLINQVPLSMHIVFDYVIAAVLIASPFLFSFSDESKPTAVFLAGGVVWLLMSIGTRYRKEEIPARGEPKRRRGRRDGEGAGDRGEPALAGDAALAGELAPAATDEAASADRPARGGGRLPPAGSGSYGGAAASSRDGGASGSPVDSTGQERPSRLHRSADAVPDESIPEFEPPPRGD
jgi:hypothetical protein